MKTVLWLCFVLLAGIYICRPVVDPDLWWHITIGRWILANHTVPTSEHWNMFALGAPWIAYSWSTEIIFALADRLWPTHGLLVLEILFATLLSLSLGYCFSRLAKDWAMGALLSIYCTVACFSHFTLRPQSLVWVVFAWLIFNCQKIAEEGLTRKRGAAVFLLMMFWANIHLSAILGLLLIVSWLFEPPTTVAARRTEQKDWLKTLLLGFAGTLVTPYLGKEWLIFAKKSSHPFSHSSIVEFSPAIITQYATVFLMLLLFFVGVFFYKAPRTFKPVRLVGFCAFLLGALAVVKFLPFAVIMAGALLARAWAEARGESAVLGNLAEAVHRFKNLVLSIPAKGLSFVCICLVVVMVHNLWLKPLDLDLTPKAALDFIQEKKLEHPLLNTFGTGGYVMYRFSDERGNLPHPVAIDGRTNVTPPHVAKAENQALNGQREWRDFLNIVHPKTILWPAISPLVSILEAGGQWCTVFKSREVVMIPKDYFESRKSDFKAENCS